MTTTDTSAAKRILRTKVPEITAVFWVLKLLTTGMGEAISDAMGQKSVPVAAGVGITADFFAKESRQQVLLVRPFAITYRYPGGVYINRAKRQERPAVLAFREWLSNEAAATIEKI